MRRGAIVARVNHAWPLILVAFVAGAAIAAQPGINATLGRGLGGAVLAALVSFAVGTIALTLVALARQEALPSGAAVGAIPLWAWTGGLLGAFFVTVSIVAAPRLGAGTLVAVAIAGQLTAALLLDHFGWLGFAERAATLPRIAGVGLLLGGAALVRFG